MAAIGYEMFGFAASILGTAFLLIPFAYALVTGGLPSARMQALDVLLNETESLLRTALQERTINYRYYELMFQEEMWMYVTYYSLITAHLLLTTTCP